MGAYVLVCDRVGHGDSTSEPADSSIQICTSNVYDTDSEYTIIDLYAVRPESHDTQKKEVKPFIHQIKLHGLEGETIQVWGLFDNGAMVDAMSTKMYLQVKHKLAPLEKSIRRLQMANGSIVTPAGCWKGTVELGGTTVTGSFEVFDSGGGWDFLFGKRLMTAFSAVHDYATDEVFLPARQCTLQNQHEAATQPPHEKMHETKEGDNAQSPVRGVLIGHHDTSPSVVDTSTPVRTHGQVLAVDEPQAEEQETTMGDRATSPSREVQKITPAKEEQPANSNPSRRAAVEEVEDDDNPKHRTRQEEEKAAEASKEERLHQKKQARERARAMWKMWKGPSQ